jgi:hypothetical protein
MNELLLALLGFVLGILSTLITQAFTRRWQIEDVRKRRKIDHLHHVREWIETYRDLFKCKFPQVSELVLANKYFAPNYGEVFLEFDGWVLKQDDKMYLRVYNALMEFRNSESKCEKAERDIILSLYALGARDYGNYLQSIISLIAHKLFRLSYRDFLSISSSFFYVPRGFLRDVSPYLFELSKQRDRLFTDFPRRFSYYINFAQLENTEPKDVSKLIVPRLPQRHYPDIANPLTREYLEAYRKAEPQPYTEQEVELLDSMNDLDILRGRAEQAIEKIFLIIDKYETLWLTPE